MQEVEFSDLKGKILASITADKYDEEMIFETVNGERYKLFHKQDCCETVVIEDIIGDLSDLIGSPILLAEEIVYAQDFNPAEVVVPEYQDSFTWTFYKLATIKGYVTVRWHGDSNGYYSESVDFEKVS